MTDRQTDTHFVWRGARCNKFTRKFLLKYFVWWLHVAAVCKKIYNSERNVYKYLSLIHI